MAQVYKVENKRYDIIEIDSAEDTSYDLTDADHNRWIKVNTDTIDVDINMPDGLTQGFRCVVENTGETVVNYVNGSGTSVATQQGRFTEDKWRTVELVFDNSEWRIQGFVGRQDLGALFDVNTEVDGGPEPGDALTFDSDLQTWVPASPTPYTPVTEQTISYSLTEDDHNQTIVFNSGSPRNLVVNLGLPDGLYCRILNIGTGVVTVNVAGTLQAISNTLVQWQSMELVHGGSDTYYGSVSYTEPPAAPTYLEDSYVGSIPTLSSATSESLVIGSDADSQNDVQIVIGKDSVARGLGDITIGDSSVTLTTGGVHRISIGNESRINGDYSIAFGYDNEISGIESVGIGYLAEVTGNRAVQIIGGAAANDEDESIKFIDTWIACNQGVIIPQETTNNTVTNQSRFVADVVDGGVEHHPSFGHLAFSRTDKLLYMSTGTTLGNKVWHPINTPPGTDYLESRIRHYNLVNGVIGGIYSPPEYETHLWFTDINDSAGANNSNEEWTTLKWIDASVLTGNNDRKYLKNEPFFVRGGGGAGFSNPTWFDRKAVRWVRTGNTLGFTGAGSSNGPFNVDRSLFDAVFPNAQTKDRILFTGQTNTDENGIYRLDSIGTSFVTFNRPADLQIGDSLSTDNIWAWEDEVIWNADSAITIGDPVTFTQGAASNVFNSNEGLYFQPTTDGVFRVKMQLRLISVDAFASFNARAKVRLYRDATIIEEWQVRLATQDDGGANILGNIRINESLELEAERHHFTITFYDTPQYVFIQSTGSGYLRSYIKITPEQLYFAPNNV